MKKYILRHKGLAALTLLFGTAFSVSSALIALILRDVIDISIAGDLNRFTEIILQTALFLAVLGLCYGLYSTFGKKLVCKVTKDLRGDAFDGIFKKNISDFKAVNSADYLSALTNDVKNVEENYMIPLLLCLENIVVFMASFGVMLYLSPLVLLCLFAAVLLLIAIPALFQNPIQKRQEDFSKKQAGLTVAVKDFLSGFEVIRAYRMNPYIAEAFDEKNGTVTRAKYRLDKVVAVVEALSALLGVVVQCSVLFMAAYLIITGEITPGTLVGLVSVSGTIVMPIQILSQNIPKIKGSKPIIERLEKLIRYRDSAFTGIVRPTFKTDIRLENLRFGYTEDRPILKGIHFTFEKGKKYAIVGKSGCGKTTLINLLNGYYAAFEGKILYDGADMRGLDIEKLNGMSSVIHQNVYMFDESIKDNICLHKPVEADALQSALTLSGVELFLGDGKSLDTPVGENGNALSGGQRQRIAVARALVQGTPILVLDEGTSAVDMQTAYDIESQLLKIEDLTVITITHSLNAALLNGYDQIIFMDEGHILESGTFQSLTEARGAFFDFLHVKK